MLTLRSNSIEILLYAQFGPGTTFPQVVKDSVNLGGCTETVRYLRENNLI